MKVSVITPCYNAGDHLAQAVESVLYQARSGWELEYLVMDGGSTDGTLERLRAYDGITRIVSEPDGGPAAAINKGLSLASGDLVAWLNADDRYCPGALDRAVQAMKSRPEAAMLFGRCLIVDEEGREIRRSITRVKELLGRGHSRFLYQCVNYVSQPATLLRRSAAQAAGPLDETLKAAWDYEFFLRVFRQGPVVRLGGDPMACFRWHPGSISGAHFERQFAEELEAAKQDAGRRSMQALLHTCVQWGIVTIYRRMTR